MVVNQQLFFDKRAADDIREHPNYLKDAILEALEQIKSENLRTKGLPVIGINGKQYYQYQKDVSGHKMRILFHIKPDNVIIVERLVMVD